MEGRYEEASGTGRRELGGNERVHVEGHTSVVQLGDGSKPFLPRRVPYLQSHHGRGVDVDNPLGEERGAYGGLGRGRQVDGFDVAMDQAGLADALRSEDYDLGL
jgi:hypothetical protein